MSHTAGDSAFETTFREFKQQIGGMAYHFWTKAMPRLSHFRKKTDPEPLEMVVQESDREKIYQFMYLQPQNEITQLIQSLQIDQEDGKSKKAA